MISFQDNDFWRATKSKSYELPSDVPISKERYVDELNKLEELKNNNRITDEEYAEKLNALQQLKQSEQQDTHQNDENPDELEDEEDFDKFIGTVMHETDHLTQDAYFKLSRFKQLELCVSILATSIKLNDLISKIPRDDVIHRLIIKFAKMIDNRLKLKSPPSYGQIITDIEETVKGIKKIQMKVFTGNQEVNENLRPLSKQVLLDSVFQIKLKEFFGRSPIDLEFYEFGGFRSASGQDEDTKIHYNSDTLFGQAPNDFEEYNFDIAVFYYNVYDENEFTFYFTTTNLTLKVTDHIEPEPKIDDSVPVHKSIMPKVFTFIWKLFKILLVLSAILFLGWLMYKIYEKEYYLRVWSLLVDLTTCISSACISLKEAISSVCKSLKDKISSQIDQTGK